MLSAPYVQPSHRPDCQRSEMRNSIFVIASLSFGGRSERVKMRDISASGALIEGPILPIAGTPCRLVRGELAIEAVVVWANSGRIGLKFRNRTQVKAWLPSGQMTQSQVDQEVATAKAELVGKPPASPNRTLQSPLLTNVDINAVADALATLADELADDPVVVGRFMSKLQQLDVGVQTLRKVAELVQTSERF